VTDGDGVIYIGNVKMTPRSSQSDTYRFMSIDDAIAFSRITRTTIWAFVDKCDEDEHPGRTFRIYPGGRIEDWTDALERSKNRRKGLAPNRTRLKPEYSGFQVDE
jgi:hypothetical protein